MSADPHDDLMTEKLERERRDDRALIERSQALRARNQLLLEEVAERIAAQRRRAAAAAARADTAGVIRIVYVLLTRLEDAIHQLRDYLRPYGGE